MLDPSIIRHCGHPEACCFSITFQSTPSVLGPVLGIKEEGGFVFCFDDCPKGTGSGVGVVV